jgi:predicted alpha/beta hydrolase family esterase
MRNIIIIHGCPSSKEKALNPETRHYDKEWMPWLKSTLTKKGLKVELPQMPHPWAPVYADYKRRFEKLSVNEDTILIGHSCGCAFLVRWLGESKTKISKLILVAPWIIPAETNEIRKKFYGFKIDKSIPNRVKEIVMFISDDEVEEGKESLKILHNAIGGKVIELTGRGHFTFKHMGTKEFPELLKLILP